MLKYFLPYLRRYRYYFWSGVLSLLIVDLLDVGLPLIVKYAIDHLNSPDPLKILLICFLGYVGIVAFQGIGRFWYRIFFQGTSFKVSQDIRNEFFSHIQTLSINFFNTTKTGDLMSRATNDIEAVRHFYAIGIFIGTDIILYFLTVHPIMLFLSVKLTLLSIILLPLLPFFVNRMGNLIHNRFKEIQETSALVSNSAQENFAGIRVIKSFAQENNQISDFKDINRKYVNQNLSLARLESVFSPTLQLAAGLGVLIVIFFGGWETINGNISTGTFVAFPFYLGRIMWPMMGLGWTISVFQRAFASMQRLQEIFNTKPEIASPVSTNQKYILGEIEFRNVSLAYPNSIFPSLADINLKIPAGTTVAIMGPLGSGKTSLVNLIPRLFDPAKGEVIIDGVNIKEYDLGLLRKAIGFVPQDVFLFSESIKENIGFGLNESTFERTIGAAEISMIHRDIESFTDKYNTMLGERGINVSGGQKQRITIARALAGNPKILILDDCLSSVDIDTEQAILSRLKNVLKERTTIIISHRIPVAKIADMIIFMESGKITELGTHAELIARNGRYANFYHYQELITDLEKV